MRYDPRPFRNDNYAFATIARRIGSALLTFRRPRGKRTSRVSNRCPPIYLRRSRCGTHGYQFGQYNPALGDGRGFLYAQLRDERGRLLDLGTKGSGTTPYSRGGDGRLTLKGGVREVLATELLSALGVPTSASFSLFETGERLARGDEPSPTRSSVLVRLSHSHVRFGTFERHAFERRPDRLATLVTYVVRHYFPALSPKTPIAELAPALLLAIAARLGDLVACWTVAGFVHGVLNTDNMNVTGESFDYGPWRFLPAFDAGFTAAYFDQRGLYAFGRQPAAVLWNVQRLNDALSLVAPSLDDDALEAAYGMRFARTLADRTLDRLGLAPRTPEADTAVADAVFAFLEASGAPYAGFFFDWCGGEVRAAHALESPRRDAYAAPAFAAVRDAWRGYTARRTDLAARPYFARAAPSDLLYDEVEAIWAPIAERDDWSRFEQKIADLRVVGDAHADLWRPLEAASSLLSDRRPRTPAAPAVTRKARDAFNHQPQPRTTIHQSLDEARALRDARIPPTLATGS